MNIQDIADISAAVAVLSMGILGLRMLLTPFILSVFKET
jgi:hypothetical protein